MTNNIVEGTTRLFRDHVYKLHGLIKVILSNMDATFTNRFGNALHGFFGTRLAMSIIFHPQTNGKLEQNNHVIHDMLWHYVNSIHDNWDEFLVMVEFAYSEFWQEYVQNILFVVNTCQHPMTLFTWINRCQVPTANKIVGHMSNVIGQANKQLIDAQK